MKRLAALAVISALGLAALASTDAKAQYQNCGGYYGGCGGYYGGSGGYYGGWLCGGSCLWLL
jgi:hypothetical protein